MNKGKKLYKSEDDKIILGVCGGIGEYLGVDPTLIRLLWIFFSMATAIFGGIFAYVISAIIIPDRQTGDYR